MSTNDRRRERIVLLAVGLTACEGQSVCDRLGALCTVHDAELRMELGASVDATADLDGDGHLDVVTAAPRGGLSIVWGLERRRDYQLFAGGVPDAGIADVDGDGDLDVVFITADPPELRVLDNRGGRELVDARMAGLPGRPQSLWVGSLADGEGLDIVVGSALAGGLTTFRDGEAQQVEVGEALVAVEAADLDGDGRREIVAADLAGSALFVVRAEESGFAAPQRIASGPAPEYLELYDFDGDGSLDALTHGRAGPEVWFHAGDGAGGFAGPRAITVQERPSEGFVAHRDASGGRWMILADGGLVVASELDAEDRVVRRVLGSTSGYTGVRRDGDGVFGHGAYGARYSLAPSVMFSEAWRIGGKSYAPLVLADFDVDGVLDLGVTGKDGVVVIHSGDTRLPMGVSSGVTVPQDELSMISADVTGDGLLDLVIGGVESIQVAVGRGDGQFTMGQPVVLPLDPRALHAFDPLGSGAAAVAIAPGDALAQPNSLVLRFDAAGAVAGFTQPIVTGYVEAMASSDVDGDARDDLVLVVLEGSERSLVIVPGDELKPVRSRGLSVEVPVMDGIGLAVGDLTGDGAVDAVLVGLEVVVRLSDIGAEGPLTVTTDYEVFGLNGGAIGIVDVDGDDHRDIVYASKRYTGVVLVDAEGQFAPQAQFRDNTSNYTMQVEDTAATVATVNGRGISVSTPGVVPSLARTAVFDGGSGPLTRMATGDVDGDLRTDIVVSADDVTSGIGLGLLWGGENGPRRAFWMNYIQPELLAVKQLDDRPGDEIVTAGRYEGVRVWTFMDGYIDVVAGHVMAQPGVMHGIAVAARRGAAHDIVVLGSSEEVMRVVALPRDDGGAFLEDEVILWEAPGADDSGATSELAVGDYDDDGYDDIAVWPGHGEAVRVIWGDERRAGEVMALDGDALNVQHIVSVDSDGDHVDDLILGSNRGVYRVDLRGRDVREPVSLTDKVTFGWLVLADVEGDGVVDIFGGSPWWLSGVFRSQDGEERQDLHFVERSGGEFAALDGDDILDLVGIRDGHVVTRLSARGAP